MKKPQTHRMEARQTFIGLIKKIRKGKKLINGWFYKLPPYIVIKCL
ncbi:hypothetical protein [Hoylesella timonensis]|nr:hypothetical protein [Hoylesella timonensis]